MEDRRKSGSQKLFTALLSPETAAKMEAESRAWLVRCPNCGYEQSVWDWGGVRYKAAGTNYWFRRCPNCGKRGWLKVYRSEGPLPEVPVVPRPPGIMSRWLLWVLLLGAAVAAFVALIATILLLTTGLTQPVVSAGDDFMTALKTGDFAHAYALCTPELQNELGSVSGMSTLVADNRPAEWNWTSRSIRNGVGRVDGTFNDISGKPGTVQLVFRQVDNNWKVDSFRFNPT
jgi:ribosomal protein S27E